MRSGLARGSRWRGALVASLTLAALGALPSAASAVTFGANLNRPVEDLGTCFEVFQSYSFGAVNSPSCTVESQNFSTGETGFPPVGRGTVTKVRVKVGPETGPMQIVVEQALRADNPSDPGHPTYACCKAVQLSQVFTPVPNAITEVPVNLSVRQDISPDPATGLYVDQHLALSVLAPNVPIPASSDSQGFVGAWTPAYTLGQERVDSWGLGPGATILFNADWAQGSAGPNNCTATKSEAQSAAKKKAKKKKKKKKRKSGCAKKKKKKKGKKKKGKRKRARRA